MTLPRPHLYRLYGLVAASSFVLPELPPADEGETPDVFITTGKTPVSLPRPAKRAGCYETGPGALLIWLPGVARFLVTQGREISVEPETEADPAEVRRLLLSAPLGALLLQRGLLPFHASSLVLGETGILILGGPCAGKSTLAGLLLAQGGRLLSDDLAGVRLDAEGKPWALPAYPELKLWPDSLAALGREPATLAPLRRDHEKRVLRLTAEFAARPVPLRTVYLIEPGHGAAVSLREAEGAARAAALLKHVYRLDFLAGAERETAFREVGRLAKTIRVLKILLPSSLAAGEAAARLIAEEGGR